LTDVRRTQPEHPEFVHTYVPGKGATTLLLLHGTGGDERSLIPLAKSVDEEAAIIAVRGKVLENGMPRFFRRFAEGVFDIKDLKFRANELADFLGWASREYGFSPGSLVALGYSNGANIGATLLLLRPEVLGGAILFRATMPLVPESVPDLSGKRVFVSAGRYDEMTPQAKTEELEEFLKAAGAQVTTNWEEATHSLTRQEIEKAASWLRS
jgi:phospholipase/carboxylesterase